ncbi:MAG: NAD(P)-dependent oxidoreductase [Flavobacteriales bacterium TMED235]|nr:MAG: NAD(P)-dependent oxidoreductase [Flavobacteriales bacterium TMED235]|tara:strand:+ start:770 stop:1630 length:861 start_codon:yes stop_codon:yes gene_type:complete
MKKNILITGVNGFIGSNFAKKNSKKYNLYGIVKDNKRKIKGVKYLKIKNFYKQTNNKIDYIIHLAQSKNYKEFPNKSKDIFNSNIKLTAEILEFARINRIKKFIYLSTGSVYEKTKKKEINENTGIDLKKTDFYSSSKISSELIIKSYQNFFDIVILRIFFPYGPNQKIKMLIPSIIKKIKNKEKIIINNNLRFNPIYIDDLVLSIEKSMFLKGLNHINLAGIEKITIEKLIKIISKILKQKPIIKKINNNSDNFISEIKLAKKKLIVPTTTLYKGILNILKKSKI